MRAPVWLLLALLCITSLAGAADFSATRITLTGDTNRPEMSTFIPGEPINLLFTVDGLTPADADLLLNVMVSDADGRELEHVSINLPNNTTGQWSTTLATPEHGLGFYRVAASLSNGVTLREAGSRPAGYFTYAIVPDPATRRLYPEAETHFGMQGGFNPKINNLPLLGVRWVMDGQFGWHRTEPDRAGQLAEKLASATFPARPETTTWKFCTVRMQGQEAPWTVYPVLTGMIIPAPRWAQQDQANYPKQGPLSPAGEAAWKSYCEAAGKAYSALYPERTQRIYEVTWEPNTPWNFHGSDDEVVRIYQIAYTALHAADPKAVVIGPAGASIHLSSVQWYETLLKKGIGRYLDGVSIHPYHPQPPEREGLIANIHALKAVIARYTGRDLPLYGTEQGYKLVGSPGKDLQHAQGMIRTQLIMLGEGFRFNFAFYVHDTGTMREPDGGYGLYYGLTPGSVPGSGKLGPKPVVPAYAAMTWLLEGHRSAGPIAWLGDTAWGYIYERPGDVVLAVWDYGDAPRTVTLPVGVKQVAVYDWMGNGATVPAPGGMLTVTLGKTPLYLKGVSPSLWGKGAVQAIRLGAAQVTGYPGGTVRMTGTLQVPGGQAVQGTLLVEPEQHSRLPRVQQPVTIPAGKVVPYTCTLALPVGLAPGSYPLKLLLQTAQGTIAATGLRLQVESPVAITGIAPTVQAPGTVGVSVQLRDARGQGVQGTLYTRITGVPESTMTTAFTLPPGATTRIPVWYPEVEVSPFRTYQVVATVETAAGDRSTTTVATNFLTARQLARAPVIDGALDEWADIPALPLRGQAALVRSPQFHTSADDLTATLRFAWDARALYLAIDVTDDAYLQPHTGVMIWQGDCLQLGINPEHGTGLALSGNGLADQALRPHDSEIALALTSAGPQAFRHLTFAPDRLPSGLIPPAQLPLAVRREGNHLIYEAALPWSTLGYAAAPRAGEVLGLALTINDLDDPKQPDPSALGIFTLKKPQEFGGVLLQGAQ